MMRRGSLAETPVVSSVEGAAGTLLKVVEAAAVEGDDILKELDQLEERGEGAPAAWDTGVANLSSGTRVQYLYVCQAANEALACFTVSKLVALEGLRPCARWSPGRWTPTARRPPR